jgi:2-polyprenyl-3-methyl-5-hydroxy-6-metoxy-1,4-benzoquinol methylase
MKDTQPGYQASEQIHFDQLADTTGETYWGNKTAAAVVRMRRRAALLHRALRDFPDPLVLELGCGTGTFSKYVLQELPQLRVTGCDISPKAIQLASAHCAEYANATFEVADVISEHYAPDSFDAVIGCSILHHLFPVEKVLAECFRMLKSRGIIWFTEPNMMHPAVAVEKNIHFIKRRLQSTEDETAFFRWMLAKKLRNVGFRDVSVQPYDFIPPIFPRPLLGALDRVGRVVERIPLVREFAGNVLVTARKGDSSDGRPGRRVEAETVH